MAYSEAWRDPEVLKNPSRTGALSVLKKHRVKFVTFVLIGGGLFVLGLLIQAVLTSRMHIGSFDSYLVQAIVTNELSFVLNYRITWRHANTPWVMAFWRFNAQKVLIVTVNLLLYWGVVKLGVNYLAANVLLAIIFTFVNYVGAEKFVFLTSVRLVTAVSGELPRLAESVPLIRHHHHDDADTDPMRQEEGIAALLAIADQQRGPGRPGPASPFGARTRDTRPDLVAVPALRRRAGGRDQG